MQPKLRPSDVHTIGQAVRYYRQQRGLSQDTLCGESAVAQAIIDRIERGHNTTVKTLLKLCKAMKVTLAELATLAGV